MVVTRWIGDSEPNDYDVEKWRIGQLHSSGAKIITGMKRQLVDTSFETIGGYQRLVRSAVHIGNNRF